ncbi:Uncharacterised protein [Mycobacteroides abscessus subsp. abscessus]|uniref:hypothetical protein n=1 Tax=Mycobacteroides abscessus TaxID=36809 RepID=UPI00092B9AEB|nr:hypothetical protein [Mycobacteroides abscessus]SHU71800.1 Uncharacterised protein [Mycobacteroides abscessus subsp. abscessus]
MPHALSRPRHSGDKIAEAEALSFARRVREACEELYATPYNTVARAAMVDLLVNEAPDADEAMAKAVADYRSNL